MHVTSLPGKHGTGDFGPQAYKFADLLKAAGQGYWQVLPLNPFGPKSHGSPYSGTSAFAMSTLLISPEMLHQDGVLAGEDLHGDHSFDESSVDYVAVEKYKTAMLFKAADKFITGAKDARFEQFCEEQKSWLDDFAMFAAFSEAFGEKDWCDWPKGLRDRHSEDMQSACNEYAGAIMRQKVLQYFAANQWRKLKEYCNGQGVKIIGDVPIYLMYHSAEVWAHPELFKLDKSKKPAAIAGVPPDLFSRTGQLWDTPVYDWDAMKKEGYRWWLARMATNLRVFDMVRLDHFRGFAGYWEVPRRVSR